MHQFKFPRIALNSLLLWSAVFLVSCDQDKQETNRSLEQHEEALAKFQEAQKSFKKIIATVRDEKSFDSAKPELYQVITEWDEARKMFEKLSPPSEEDQERISKLISDGHRNTEPTGDDMNNIYSIAERKSEIEKWMQDFFQAGNEVGVELTRLYGETDYPETNKSRDLDMDLPGS